VVTVIVNASQADGWTSSNDYVILDIDSTGSYQGTGSCYIQYQAVTRTVNLVADSGSGYAGSGALGAAQTLSNSQCSVGLATGTATVSGAILTLTLPITFTTGFPGAKSLWAEPFPNTFYEAFLVGSLNVVGPAPTITSLSTTAGPAGTPVTISGNNFGNSQWFSTVTFNGTPATVTSWSPTSIGLTVPGGTPTDTPITLAVTVGGVTASSTFTVYPTPVIQSLSPGAGPAGYSVQITGTNFGSPQGSSSVTFNGTNAAVTSWTATSISVTAPNIAAGVAPVVVRVRSIPSAPVNFTVQQTVVQTYTNSPSTTYTWTAPAGVTSVLVECWGSGGKGGNAVDVYSSQLNQYSWVSGGGGGGGAYAKRTSYAVTPGNSYQIVVGSGGGTSASLFGGSVCAADYGSNGQDGYTNAGAFYTGSGGTAGQASNSSGVPTTSGSNGATGGNPYGGSGGAGANGGAGAGATNLCSSPAPSGNAPGGGAAGGTSINNNGSACACNTGGAGAAGQVRLTYNQ
jgi:hypothetical protein